MTAPAIESAVRPLRTAVIAVLKIGVPSVANRVKSGTVQQGLATPYILLQGYEELSDNFFGRGGSKVSFIIKGFNLIALGDAPLLELYDACYRTLHRRILSVTAHIQLSGLVRLELVYPDPENNELIQFAASYEGVTRNT